jgi:voltage-gated potassium channel
MGLKWKNLFSFLPNLATLSHVHKHIESLLLAFTLFLADIVIGIIGYMWLQEYTFVNAIYMTAITIATVGYGEIQPLDDVGKVFTSCYILLNLGIFAYILSIVTSYLFEGKLKSIFRNYMSDKEFDRYKNHIIVCGYGRNGSKACEELMRSGKEFVVIEKSPEARQSTPSSKNVKIMVADATIDENLRIAGIERADVIIITTPSDAANVFITLTARALNPGIRIIARASELQTEAKLYRAGADKVILPDILGGMFMAQLVTKPVVIEFLDLLSGVSGENYRMEEVHFSQLKKEFKDKTLKELSIKQNTGATVIGVKDDVKGLIPSPPSDTFIGKDDTLIVLGHQDNLTIFFNQYTDTKYEWK